MRKLDNLILSFNVVTPLCFVMAIGYFLKYMKMFDENSLKVMNNVTFKVFLPCLLFYNIYTTDMGSVFNLKLLIFATVSILVLFTFLFFFIPKIEKDNERIIFDIRIILKKLTNNLSAFYLFTHCLCYYSI
ncbi:MAG: AEC family transporter [Terrisporobacter sp.]|uniref:AEC family transporter n=1 Tax=Terrisporobacter sp. TaxID=1965305 RepID=UPI002FE6E2D3